MRPWRSRKYLDRIRNLPCQLCGVDDGTIVPAHYSGIYSQQLGKGMGQKSSDHCVAALCHPCHESMDKYTDGNTDARAVRFMLAIFKTQWELLNESGKN